MRGCLRYGSLILHKTWGGPLGDSGAQSLAPAPLAREREPKGRLSRWLVLGSELVLVLFHELSDGLPVIHKLAVLAKVQGDREAA